jgi:hypothetical protein
VSDDLISVGEALVIVTRRGVSAEEWSQAIADGVVQAWTTADGHLQVQRQDAESWRPRTVDRCRLDGLVAQRDELDRLIHDEVLRLRDDGAGWSEIAEILGLTEDDARMAYEGRPA